MIMCCCGTGPPTETICVRTWNCNGTPHNGTAVTLTPTGGAANTGTGNFYCWPNLAPGTYTVAAAFGIRTVSQVVTIVGGGATTYVDNYLVVVTGIQVCAQKCGGGATTGDGVTMTTAPTLATRAATYPCFAWTVPTSPTFPIIVTINYTDCDGAAATKTVTYNSADGCSVTASGTADITSGCFPVSVCGCNGMALAGATVTSSTGSATTNSLGVAVLHGAPNTAVGTVTISHARFVTKSLNCSGRNYGCSALDCGSSEPNGKLAIDATNYVCTGCCAVPFKKTFSITFGGGTVTQTWNGTNWSGCVDITNTNGCGVPGQLCSGATTRVTITTVRDGNCNWFT